MPWASVIGAVAGGLLSSGGSKQSGGAQVKTEQQNAPWNQFSPYLTGNIQYMDQLYPNPYPGLYPSAGSLYAKTQGGYPGPFIAPQSPYTTQGQQKLVGDANDPNSPVNRATGELNKTIGGNYLDVTSNPYLKNAVDASVKTATDAAQMGVSSRFSGDNYGGSANQEWLGRSIANATAPIAANAYLGAYNTERSNQLNAIPLASGLQVAGASPYLTAGAIGDARGAAEVTAGQQQFYSPWDVLSRYGSNIGAIQTPASGSATTSYPTFSNPWANAVGGAIGGAQIGQKIGGYFGSSSPTPYAGSPAFYSNGGWGTGNSFGNQDYGQFFGT